MSKKVKKLRKYVNRNIVSDTSEVKKELLELQETKSKILKGTGFLGKLGEFSQKAKINREINLRSAYLRDKVKLRNLKLKKEINQLKEESRSELKPLTLRSLYGN